MKRSASLIKAFSGHDGGAGFKRGVCALGTFAINPLVYPHGRAHATLRGAVSIQFISNKTGFARPVFA